MSIHAINTVLQQMSHLAAQAENRAEPLSNGEIPFSQLLSEHLQQLNQLQTHATQQAQSFELGTPGISLNNVMVDLQKSTLALNIGIQVRNKVVSAYQNVMNMQV